MKDRAVLHSTFVIERHYAAKPERVYAAFSDPVKKRRWFVEGDGFAVDEYVMDFRVGGFERSKFRGSEGPMTGVPITNDTQYMDIVPNQRIVTSYSMSIQDKPFSASLTTFEFLASGEGTKLVFTEQAAFFEGSDGAKMREHGWGQLLDALGKELER